MERLDEGANPPYLKLRFAYPPEPRDAAVAYIYEVNYSHFAGVIRANHRLDLTTLFVGLSASSGVMAAATGPLLGAPSLLLSRYGP